MTTFEAAAGLLHRATGNLQARATRKAQRQAAAKVALTAAASIRRFVLVTGALASFSYAAFSIFTPAGFVVAGLCALFLEQSMSND